MERKITMLSEDIDILLGGWKSNEDATKAQKKQWPQNRKLPKTLLSKDATNCLLLLKEDGFDGEPVGSMTETTSRHYFYDSQEKLWPPDRDIVRLGLFFHLSLYKTLAMALKGQWERYYLKEMDWRNIILNPSEILKNNPKDAMDKSKGFNPGLNKVATAEELFSFFEEHGNVASKEGYDSNKFLTLINQMITEYMHLHALDSPEVEHFITRQKEEQKKLQIASAEDQEEFWIKKCSWIEAEQEIGRILLARENQRLKNFNILQKWNSQFGEVYLRLVEVECRYHSLGRQAQIKEADRSLSAEEVERFDAERRKEEEEKIKKLMQDIAAAHLLTLFGPNGTACGGEELKSYQKECKKMLLEIFKRTHADVVDIYNFTDNQKRKLREYFDKAIQIRDEEQGLDERSVGVLQEILASVKSIWETMGIDVNAESIIQGATLKEQLDWFEAQIKKLEEAKKHIDAELYALRTDKDVQEKLATMASEETIANTVKVLEEKRQWYEEQITELEARLKRLFEVGEKK